METQRQPRRRRRSKAPTRCARCLENPQNRKYVTMWNTIACRKIAGTAAPCQDELQEYLARHPHVQVYTDQDGGPEAIKQRRKERNKEKERRKRERKKLSNDGEAQNFNAVIDGREVDCLDNGGTMTKKIVQTNVGLTDRVGGCMQEESQRPTINEEEAEGLLRVSSVEPESLKVVEKEKPGEEKKGTKGEHTDRTYADDILNIGPILEGEQAPTRFTALLEEEKDSKKNQQESNITEVKLQRGVEAGLLTPVNQSREPHQSMPGDIKKRIASNTNRGGRKRKLPRFVNPYLQDISFAQRVWTAEAYAAIAEREKKRKREAAVQEDDDEIREFRELINRIY